MLVVEGERRQLTSIQGIIFLIIGLLFNAVGNGITVATNMGSAPWTASAANLANVTHEPIGAYLWLYGLLAANFTAVLLGHLDVRRFISNLAFVFFFSIIINYISQLFISMGMMSLMWYLRILIDFIGIIMVAIGVSITQRVQIVLHPMDDVVVITRFKYFHGNATVSQLVNFMIPMVMSFTVWAVTHELVALNVGTIFSFLAQGMIIGWADKHVFSRLVHRVTNY